MAHSNPYRGVNAHLHSYFQAHGGWTSFHTSMITAIAQALDADLPDGFVVDIERSLQIREFHPDTGERIRRPEPDVTIWQRSPAVVGRGVGDAPSVVQPLPETLDDEDAVSFSAVVIHEVLPDGVLGRPITQIEILSSTNKSGEGGHIYRQKRYIALNTGLALVEIDLLHETPPVIRGIPDYPHQPGSAPYRVIVSIPTPTFQYGVASTYLFVVDEPLPTIALPLGAAGDMPLALEPIYQRVFDSLTTYRLLSDLSKPPLNFDRYSQTDQARITRVMASAADKR
jgi:hypothetical protein